ncbi:MAG: hypothetical protein J6S86_04010 [Alphaproteobacteria bacterium]|nr:hypothetical protein [Alphaproteobacteria bacterium]
MSLVKIFSGSMLCLAMAVFSLISLTSCDDSNIYAKTIADCTWEGGDEAVFYFKINFIAEEGEGIYGEGEDWGGEPFKNRPIELHTVNHVSELKKRKGYKPGMKPLKHQKIKIKYEKKYPYMVGFLEYFKYQDEQGNIVELK